MRALTRFVGHGARARRARGSGGLRVSADHRPARTTRAGRARNARRARRPRSGDSRRHPCAHQPAGVISRRARAGPRALRQVLHRCATPTTAAGGKRRSATGCFRSHPDLRAAATQDLTDGELFYIIENGVRFTGMPAFGTGQPGSGRRRSRCGSSSISSATCRGSRRRNSRGWKGSIRCNDHSPESAVSRSTRRGPPCGDQTGEARRLPAARVTRLRAQIGSNGFTPNSRLVSASPSVHPAPARPIATPMAASRDYRAKSRHARDGACRGAERDADSNLSWRRWTTARSGPSRARLGAREQERDDREQTEQPRLEAPRRR